MLESTASLPITALAADTCRSLSAIFTDIDGTMTDADGRVPARSLAALEQARATGLRVLVVTGRPAGWCDMIARTWPVDGVVGENGGLAFHLDGREMVRDFLVTPEERHRNRQRLDRIAQQALQQVSGCAIASDQPYRELDLAVDFAEDVGPLDDAAIDAIVQLFTDAGAHAKVSNIHVNGWFGDYDKLGMCRRVASRWWELDTDGDRERVLFLGDSPNDEPMFEHFPHTVGVANVQQFLERMSYPPAYVTDAGHADGFVEALGRITSSRSV